MCFDAFFWSLAVRLPGASDSDGLGFSPLVPRDDGGAWALVLLLSYVSCAVWLSLPGYDPVRGFRRGW